jgi:hypothetical protein
MFPFYPSNLVTPIIEPVGTLARITPYPTGRLFWGGAVPRHFVPGYDRTVPPGHISQQLLARRSTGAIRVPFP